MHMNYKIKNNNLYIDLVVTEKNIKNLSKIIHYYICIYIYILLNVHMSVYKKKNNNTILHLRIKSKYTIY